MNLVQYMYLEETIITVVGFVGALSAVGEHVSGQV